MNILTKIITFVVRLLFALFGVVVLFTKKAEVPIQQICPNHRLDFYKMCAYARSPRETYPRITCIKKGDYYLIFQGHHRWGVAKRRGDDTMRIQYFV